MQRGLDIVHASGIKHKTGQNHNNTSHKNEETS